MSIKKLANPQASEKSLLKMHTSEMGCCDAETLVMGQYTATVDYGQNFDAIVVKIGGVNTTIALDVAGGLTTAKGLRVSIANALATVGYDAYYGSDNFKGIHTEGNYLQLTGEAEFVSITNNGAVTFDAFLTQSRIYKAQLTEIDHTATFGLLVVDDTAGTDLQDYAGDHGSSNAAVVAAIKVILDAKGIAYNRVTVEDGTGTDTVDITIYSAQNPDLISLDGVDFVRADVFPGFTQ